MGLELSGSFALGNMGWAKCNDFFYNSERLPNEMSWLYFGQLKGGIFFFFYVPYLFLFLIDLRKAEVYAGLIKGEKADLIPVFSFLNQLCRGILSLSSQENFKGWVRYYIYNFVISKIKALSTMLCIVGAQ
ncbi:unnamed protein product [Pipistrellus nathusii]|uniref:Uncharacterized protein n=1 Tax=Pipistrellus nathusii TaxID=59473 RepID=A0ABN9ZPV7_PIPNA